MSRSRKRPYSNADLQRRLNDLPPPKKRPKAKAKLNDEGMNGTEERYVKEKLAPRKAAGEIVEWWFEKTKLQLAPNTWYYPDFLVQLKSGELEIHEVKGGMVYEDSWIKIKIAARLFPFVFVLASYRKKQWKCTVVGEEHDRELKVS